MLFSFLQSVITTWLTRELVIWEAPMRTLRVLLCENLKSSSTMLWDKKYKQFLIPLGENNDGLYSRC